VDVELPDGLVFAPVDFERQTLRGGLEAAGFDFGQPAVFSWIGVTMYLTLDAIHATLATLAQCAPGTRVVLTYNQPPDTLAGIGAQMSARFAMLATDLGEPFISLFRPAEIEQLLDAHGYADITQFGAGEARAAYFQGRADVQITGAQWLVAVTVTPVRPRPGYPGPARL
jgi:methyltransferase (TIGR00027 family)